jgi:hypothetical protein
MAMRLQPTTDRLQIRLLDLLGSVTGQTRFGGTHESPNRQSSGAAEFLAFAPQAGGLVLETDAGIARKIVRGVLRDDPTEGAIRQRPFPQDGSIFGEVGIERAGGG